MSLEVSLVLILVSEGFANALCYCLAVKNEAFGDRRLKMKDKTIEEIH